MVERFELMRTDADFFHESTLDVVSDSSLPINHL